MPGRSIRIAKIAGIPVGVSPWWLVIVALITWTLGDSYFPETAGPIAPVAAYGLGLASALLLFASILAHEFGHALVARRFGIEIEEIDLWLLGGVARMRGEASDPRDELRYALAGPAVTALVAACFGVMALAIPVSAPSAVRALIEYQALVNALILVFNLLPAFPLDGGRVLRSVLWRRSGDLARATETAATVGRGFGYVMIALGGLELLGGFPAGAWLAIVGVFVVMAAGAQAAGAQVQAAFAGIPAREVMTSPAVGIPATVALSRAGEDYFMHYRYTSFPVLDGEGRALGLVSGPQLEALAHGGAGTGRRSMGELADRDPGLIVNEGEDVARLLERPAFARVGRAVVVDQVRRPVGVISVTDVQRTLRARRVAESAGSPR